MKSASWKISGILTIVALLLVACDRPTSSKNGSSTSTQARVYTVAAEQVTTSSAVLNGKVTMSSSVAPDLKIGFQYSKSAGIMPSNSTTVEVTDTDANYHFSAEITGLEPSTTYYFRSFVHQNGADTYGATMSFMTKDLVIVLESLDASDIKSSSATLKAKLDLADVSYSNLEYGFYWGTSETSQDKKLDGGRIINNEYSALLTDLEPNTRYWFKAYAKLDGQTAYGVVKTFMTEDTPTPEPDRSVTVGSDHVSAVSAVLMGRAIFGSSVASDLIVGFQYSKSAGILPSNSTLVEADDADANYNYTADITGLEPSTTYYFRSFIRQNNVDTYGETYSFTTKDVDSLLETLDATSIETRNAVLNAKLDLSYVKYGSISYGFYLGTSSSAQNTNLNGGEITENAFSAYSTGLEPEKQYWYKAYVTLDGQTLYSVVKSFTTEAVPVVTPDAIDLGIVVNGKKIKWGSFNLGATKPEEYGYYYAWGETEIKDIYSWSTYKLCNGGVSSLTKYNTSSSYGPVDNKTVLETGPDGDDVASKKLGGKWRMPTHAEWTALQDNCTWTWTSDYNNTGIAGRIVKSNVSGYTDKSIFLPAAGGRGDTGLRDAGSDGYYWSSSLSTDYPYFAWFVGFYSDDVDRGYYDRYDGLSVRPVSE